MKAILVRRRLRSCRKGRQPTQSGSLAVTPRGQRTFYAYNQKVTAHTMDKMCRTLGLSYVRSDPLFLGVMGLEQACLVTRNIKNRANFRGRGFLNALLRWPIKG